MVKGHYEKNHPKVVFEVEPEAIPFYSFRYSVFICMFLKNRG
ncbi:Hypothetical protein I595_2771 [Croceitalea dokdonensis DOKDO 023]|uniref:Uncharacterized protein n=1 Tax=Croceitalea dokdonensis DOKDO 023 TaxID=1300341 RepID=A0A0P7AUK2_9FLAO|nr:Hypothetical protein I595_2771 [Croceitalea dokdonensis DOKDO 023]